jgi:hypothetical protein
MEQSPIFLQDDRLAEKAKEFAKGFQQDYATRLESDLIFAYRAGWIAGEEDLLNRAKELVAVAESRVANETDR